MIVCESIFSFCWGSWELTCIELMNDDDDRRVLLLLHSSHKNSNYAIMSTKAMRYVIIYIVFWLMFWVWFFSTLLETIYVCCEWNFRCVHITFNAHPSPRRHSNDEQVDSPYHSATENTQTRKSLRKKALEAMRKGKFNQISCRAYISRTIWMGMGDGIQRRRDGRKL